MNKQILDVNRVSIREGFLVFTLLSFLEKIVKTGMKYKRNPIDAILKINDIL